MPYKNKEKEKEYLKKHKKRIREYYKKYRETHKEQLRLQSIKYAETHKEQMKQSTKRYRDKNKEKVKEWRKKWYEKNHIPKIKKEKIIKPPRVKLTEEQKLLRKRARANSDYKKNKEHILNIRRIRRRELMQDPQFRLRKALRRRFRKALKHNYKVGSFVKDLGCTISELKIYLEKQFTDGMSWDNWSFYGWHIDHIIPLDSFDLTDREQLLRACHYTNLQPLWCRDNLVKSNKILS
jgi:hypothetical protein